MAQNKIITDFTSGSVPRHLVKFMIPFMASNLLQVLYSLVDMVIVGRFVGSAGLSGVSQGASIINLLTVLAIGFCNSTQVLIAQLIGAGKREEMKKVLGTLFSVVGILGAFLAIACIGFRVQIVSLLNVPPESRDMALRYVLICGVGSIFVTGYNALSAILRGMGDSRHPFIFITSSSVINVILDLILTGYLGLGVTGAALATVISQLVSFALCLRLMIKRRDEFYFDWKLKSFRIDSEYAAKIIKLGVPLALQACAISFTMMMVNAFVNKAGVAASATFGVGLKVDDLALKLALAVQYAAAPMIGQNIGAGNEKRVKSVVYWTWTVSIIIFGIFTALLLTLGRQIFGIFTSDEAVLDLAPVFIKAIIWSFPAMALMRGSSSFLQGTGNSVLIMIFAFLDAGLRAVFCYFLGVMLNLGFFGFTLGYAIAPWGASVPGCIYFLFGKWQGKKLVSDKK